MFNGPVMPIYEIACECDDGFQISLPVTLSTTCRQAMKHLCLKRSDGNDPRFIYKPECLTVVNMNEAGQVVGFIIMDSHIKLNLCKQATVKILGFKKQFEEFQTQLNLKQITYEESVPIPKKPKTSKKLPNIPKTEEIIFMEPKIEEIRIDEKINEIDEEIVEAMDDSQMDISIPEDFGPDDKKIRKRRIIGDKAKQDPTTKNLFIPDSVELERLKRARPVSSANPDDNEWDDKFDLLLEYGRVKGTCYITKNVVCLLPNGESVRLGLWLYKQRQDKSRDKLRKDREERLQTLVNEGKLMWGFDGSLITDDDSWNMQYEAMLKYGREHDGNCNVPQMHIYTFPDGTEVRLGKWLSNQRADRNKGRLRADRQAKLQQLVDAGKLKWAVERTK